MFKRFLSSQWAVNIIGGAIATIIGTVSLIIIYGSGPSMDGHPLENLSPPPTNDAPGLRTQDVPKPDTKGVLVPKAEDCAPRTERLNEVVRLLQNYPSRPVFEGDQRIFVKANDVRREDREVDLTFAAEEYAAGGLRETIPLGSRREVLVRGLLYQVIPEDTGKADVEGSQNRLVDYVNLRVGTEAVVNDCQ